MIRATISPLRPLVKRFKWYLSRLVLSMRLPAKSPTKSVNLGPSELFVKVVQRRDTRGGARFALLRLVNYCVLFSVLTHIPISPIERGRGG